MINQTAGQTFDLTGVCLERAPAAALCAYVIRNDYVPTNGTTGLSLLQSGDFDDTFFTVNLPFAIKMFGKSSSTLYVSTNGYLGIDPNGAWGGIPSVLTPNTPSVEHIGFFKADKRMLTLYGGSKTLTQQDNRSLTVYTLRWEGYNYGGSSTVKTIVEFNFYADTETYEGFNFIDVKYATNDNGTQYLCNRVIIASTIDTISKLLPKYDIYNDKICSQYNLLGYISDLKLSDLDMENLSEKRFCEKFIVYF